MNNKDKVKQYLAEHEGINWSIGDISEELGIEVKEVSAIVRWLFHE